MDNLNTRKFCTRDKQAQRLLRLLSSPNTNSIEFRTACIETGEYMGSNVLKSLTASKSIMVCCTSEDADFYANGVVRALAGKQVTKAIFWHKEYSVNGMNMAPISMSYIEPNEDCDTVIIAKSIMRSGCVARTELLRILEKLSPSTVCIMSPVWYKDAFDNIRLEIESRKNYENLIISWLAEDSILDEGIVYPGIGGMIRERLGLTDDEVLGLPNNLNG